MANGRSDILRATQVILDEQNREVQAVRDRQLLSVVSQTGTGSGDIDADFGLDQKFRLVFVRCHFAGGTGVNPFVMLLDSAVGPAYDARLFTISQAGANRDVNLRVTGEDLLDPSPWTFDAADRVRFQWANPDGGNMTWGLTVGMALAS
jgi:hypothetical protein